MQSNATAVFNARSNRRFTRKVIGRFVLAVALIAASSFAVFAVLQPPPDITQLVPGDVSMVGSADLNWMYTNTAGIRSTPEVTGFFKQIDTQFGLSMDTDIAPWLGRLVVAKIAGKQSTQQIVGFAEIRDPSVFASSLVKLKTSPAVTGGFKTDALVIDGHGVTEFYKPGQEQSKVSLTVYKNWLVVGVGDGTIEHVFQVWDGKSQSLSENPAYSQILKKMYVAHSIGWVAGDTSGIVNGPAGGAAAIARPYAEGAAGLALFDEGLSLKNVPSNASGALVMTAPGHWMQTIFDEFHTTAQAGNPQPGAPPTDLIPQFEKIASPLTGEAVLSGIYSDGQAGATLNATTQSSGAARTAAINIAQVLTKMGVQIGHADDQWTIAEQANAPSTEFKPAMRTQDNYLQLATNPKWLTEPEGQSGLVMPADAAGSCLLVLVSFKDIDLLLNHGLNGAAQPGASTAPAIFKRNSLEKASLAAWMTIDPTGQYVTATMRLSNLDWKTTINQLIESAVHKPAA